MHHCHFHKVYFSLLVLSERQMGGLFSLGSPLNLEVEGRGGGGGKGEE